MSRTQRATSRLIIALAVAAGALFSAALAEARITRIEITSIQSPTFEGRTFGSVGAYEASDGIGFVPQKALGFPNIPGVTYTGVITVRNLFDFGPLFDDGILSINPPDFSGQVYPSFVSKVDRDGNDIAGIRLPPVAAPIATTTGWALRRTEFGGNDGCEGSGQWIPFKTTKAERMAAGDPRRSLEERYKHKDGYVREVTKAARKLEKRRLLLPADVQRYIDEAKASTLLPDAPAHGGDDDDDDDD